MFAHVVSRVGVPAAAVDPGAAAVPPGAVEGGGVPRAPPGAPEVHTKVICMQILFTLA